MREVKAKFSTEKERGNMSAMIGTIARMKVGERFICNSSQTKRALVAHVAHQFDVKITVTKADDFPGYAWAVRVA